MSDSELHDFAERLLRRAGCAINVHNGRCALVEEVLCETLTLCMETLDRLRPAAAQPPSPCLSETTGGG